MLKGKKIILGVTGSIAAYKSVYLLRLLVKAGAEVKVVMTPAVRDFVGELSFSTLSKQPVLVDLFDEQSWANHVMLGRWADLMILAPLSCNTLAKMANGICDNLLLAIYLSAQCPVLVAPAMDEDMWKHPSTRHNLSRIESFGNKVMPVGDGELASGLYGEGRMAEPEVIMDYIGSNFFLTLPLRGRKALVTAGPTYEPIDPVRFIGNYSSGKMGWAIAGELKRRGADVTLVAGPGPITNHQNDYAVIPVQTAAEMGRACEQLFAGCDLAVMAAAVADYAPLAPAQEKIKKKEERLTLELVRTRDILKTLGETKKKGQVLVGFALETRDEKKNALAKLKEKNADLVVLNSLRDPGAGFGYDTNKITIFGKEGKEFHFDTKSKKEVARDIVDTIIHLYYE